MRGEIMKWENKGAVFHRTADGTTRAHEYYYVYRVAGKYWVAGRLWFGREVDYRIKFESVEDAREYCETKDRDAVIISAV